MKTGWKGHFAITCLNNVNLEVKPLSEEYAYPYCCDTEKRMGVLQERIDRLLSK